MTDIEVNEEIAKLRASGILSKLDGIFILRGRKVKVQWRKPKKGIYRRLNR